MNQPPTPPAIPALFTEALGHLRAGRMNDAEQLYRQILAIDEHHADSLHALGLIALKRGQLADAVAVIRQAVATKNDVALYHMNLGVALQYQGQFPVAAASFRRAIALKPDLAEAHYNLGVVLQAGGHVADAATAYERAVELKPDLVEAHFNLGNVLKDRGRLDDAVACYRRALALRSNYVEAHVNLGAVFQIQGKADDAAACFETALALQPNAVGARHNLAMVRQSQSKLNEAADYCEAALRANPDDIVAHFTLGNILRQSNRSEEAAAHYQRVIALQPNHADAHLNLGLLRGDAEQLDDAVAHYRHALVINPRLAEAHNNLGNILLDQGMAEDAVTKLREALALKRDYVDAHSNLIFAMNFVTGLDTARQQEARRAWNDTLARRNGELAPLRQVAAASPRSRLRIGYVSAHFRHQAAAYAFAPVILHHDQDRFEVICYSDTSREDDVTAALRQSATLWRTTQAMDDDALAAQIVSDRIDILIDCVGHMKGNRLPVFARKPAPIQVSAWGEPTGTGLAAMDYLLADPVLIPAAERTLFAEEVIDLPCALSFWSPEDLPLEPVATTETITFGSLNRAAKITEATIALWSRVLSEVPQARLRLKDKLWNNADERERLYGRFAAHGVDPHRLVLSGTTTRAEHFAAYRTIEICLDPLPHGGGMTTLDALWMGVPVVTLRGATPSSRLASAVLSALDLRAWIADDGEAYIAKAVALAADAAQRNAMRATLRARMQRSPVGNPKLYARAVEAKYLEMHAARGVRASRRTPP